MSHHKHKTTDIIRTAQKDIIYIYFFSFYNNTDLHNKKRQIQDSMIHM